MGVGLELICYVIKEDILIHSKLEGLIAGTARSRDGMITILFG
jgi:hypothetical protein